MSALKKPYRISIYRLLSFVVLLNCFTLLVGLDLDAATGDESAVETPPSEEVSVGEGDSKVLQPRDLENTPYGGKPSGNSFIWSIVLFLFMLVVIAGFWIYTKRGGVGLRKLASSNDLRIRETKPLGNRQFLLVVEYGEQRMLLGVAPGVINHLCYLEAPEDVKIDDLNEPSSNLVP